ncbi:hypothetical protein ACWGCW_21440 [Streptomyces sp. NPDC054933]
MATWSTRRRRRLRSVDGMRRTTARSSELRVNGAVLLLLMVSAALAAWAVPHGPDGYGTRVHGPYAPAAASASTPVQPDIPRAGVHAGTVAVGAAASGLAEALGGRLTAGPAPEGGWTVTAVPPPD